MRRIEKRLWTNHVVTVCLIWSKNNCVFFFCVQVKGEYLMRKKNFINMLTVLFDYL